MNVPEGMKQFLQSWLVNVLAVLIAATILGDSIRFNFSGLLIAMVLLGMLNGMVRPLLLVLSFPLVVLTLGLFIVVINAFLLMVVSWLMPDTTASGPAFHVTSFWTACKAALIMALVNMFFHTLLGRSRIVVRRAGRSADGDDDGRGPAIPI